MNKYPIIEHCPIICIDEHFTSKIGKITEKRTTKNNEDVEKYVTVLGDWRSELRTLDRQERAGKTDPHLIRSICVLHQCLVFCFILLDKVKTLLSDKGKLSYEKISQLNDLKVDLYKLTELLDAINLIYNNFFGFKQEITIEYVYEFNLDNALSSIESAISNLNHPEVNDLFDLELTQEDILCSVLGLKDEFGCRLLKLSPYMRKHKSEKVHLLRFLKEFKEEDGIKNLRDGEKVAEILFKIGFTKHRSQFIANWITNMPDPNHKPILSWVETYIENHFKYDIFLNDEVSDFPFKNDNQNEWFTVTIPRLDEEGRHSHPINMINVESQEDALYHVGSKVAELNENNPGTEVYFHCTDHESAVDILEDRIVLGFGRKKSDFSDGEGFYMVNKAKFSLEQYGKTSTHPAIIMFDVSPQKLSKFKGIDLSSAEKDKDWKLIVEYFRSSSHGIGNLPKNLFSHIRQCDYIRGPVSLNGSIENNTLSQGVEQICIKKRELAKQIWHPSSILGVIFLKAHKLIQKGNELGSKDDDHGIAKLKIDQIIIDDM
ncbi:uncharacterized protein LOC124441726 [Xenia sp. Carnegie-2017]|uniref:uncharacterized protein LOC124441726 n=1 Tax=Xenia sp. Carnegie-2017 TaxID=2897299 RepID=UPI001F03BC7E|nr:uncharacterized protein LOC124441726 [Xenia sp. Carnegie-2017]